ncbi:unnamed protein product [Pylaiella littoralis]
MHLLMPSGDEQLRASVATQATEIAHLASAVKTLQQQRKTTRPRSRSTDKAGRKDGAQRDGKQAKTGKTNFGPCTYPGCHRPETHSTDRCRVRKEDINRGYLRQPTTKSDE